jgi:hypothetical protein
MVLNIQSRLGFLILLFVFYLSGISVNAQVYQWTRKIEGEGVVLYSQNSVIDQNSNVFVVGMFENSLNVVNQTGVYTQKSKGHYDVFVSKYDKDGNIKWTKTFGGIVLDQVHSIAVDTSGFLYLTGRFDDTVDFDPGPDTALLASKGNSDLYILKLDNSGNYVWAKRIGGKEGVEIGEYIKIDNQNNIIITGTYYNVVDFDPGPGVAELTNLPNENIFILKLDKDGNFIWVKNMQSTRYIVPSALAVDSDNNIFVAGRFEGVADLDPGNNLYSIINNSKYEQSFYTKLDKDGKFLWGKHLTFVTINQIKNDQLGQNFIFGYHVKNFSFSTDTGDYTVNSDTFFHSYIIKFNKSGEFKWIKSFKNVFCRSIEIDKECNVYSVGSIYDSVDLDPSQDSFIVKPKGLGDAYMLKLDSNGNFIWGKQWGGASSNIIKTAISIDKLGNIFTVGMFKGTLDFNPDKGIEYLSSKSESNIFIQKLGPCMATTSKIPIIACNKYRAPSGKYIWDVSGKYEDTILNKKGCDSIITINLIIEKIDATIQKTDTSLLANAIGISYQWVNCEKKYEKIIGANSKNFFTNTKGNYAVIVSNGSYSDTSICLVFGKNSTIMEKKDISFSIFPNPTSEKFSIDFGEEIKSIKVTIRNLLGQEMYSENFNEKRVVDLSINDVPGIYFVEIENDFLKRVFKMLKNK